MVMNSPKKILSFTLFFGLSGSIFANTAEEAIEAEINIQDQDAVAIWSKLANSGNTIAKYNLAKHYANGKGITKDENQAKSLMKQASQSGLAQAYTSLNKKALTSGKGVYLTFKSGPLYWLKEQKPELYTLQLASSRYEKSIIKLYEENFLKGKGGYYRYQRDGVQRYALVYGTYRTVAEAKSSIKDLPKGLKSRTPQDI
jgi:septal ring-binding cell division protein DamX